MNDTSVVVSKPVLFRQCFFGTQISISAATGSSRAWSRTSKGQSGVALLFAPQLGYVIEQDPKKLPQARLPRWELDGVRHVRRPSDAAHSVQGI